MNVLFLEETAAKTRHFGVVKTTEIVSENITCRVTSRYLYNSIFAPRKQITGYTQQFTEPWYGTVDQFR